MSAWDAQELEFELPHPDANDDGVGRGHARPPDDNGDCVGRTRGRLVSVQLLHTDPVVALLLPHRAAVTLAADGHSVVIPPVIDDHRRAEAVPAPGHPSG